MPVQWNNDDHHYEGDRPGNSRCPCPALNALANHGYIHRDGRSVTWWQLVCALREVYHLSLILAAFLTTVGILVCARWSRFGTIDLHSLSAHNLIEHDCSLAHADTKPGMQFAPSRCDEMLLCRLLGLGATKQSKPMGIRDFALARIRRALEVRANIGVMHRLIAHGEVALTMLTFGVQPSAHSGADASLVVPREQLRIWFGEDRLPEDWQRPGREVGLFRVAKMSYEVKGQISRIEDSFFQGA